MDAPARVSEARDLADIARLWAEGRSTVTVELDAIDAAGAAVLAGALEGEWRGAATRSAHRLAGSLGTFGLPAGSALAAEIETMLRGSQAVSAKRLAELAGLLRGVVEMGPPPIDAPEPDLAGAAAPVRSAASDDPSRAATVDVVIVDDNTVLTDLIQTVLASHGYTSKAIADGRLAIETLIGPDALRCRVLLLDVDLPGLDGLAVLRQLTAAGVSTTTPTIMLTARANERETVEALRSGAIDHIAKPFSMPVLLERIRLALER